MAKKGGNQTVTQQLDPTMQQWVQDIYKSAGAAAGSPGQPIHGGTRGAFDFLSGGARQGAIGNRALGGDPSAIATLMNPFLNDVVGAAKNDFADLNQLTMRQVNDAATKAGAFGGSRHGIATGTALAENARSAQGVLAGLRQGGFNDAMGRAGMLSNLGLSSAQGMHAIGDYMRNANEHNDPNRRRMDILREGIQGLPFGTQTTQPVNRNGAAGVLGGAATLGGLASTLGASTPWGWAAAGLGGLLGMF